jgi:hypothetical protein
VIGVKDSIKELYGEEIDPAYKSEPSGVWGTVLRIAGVWAEEKSPTYRRLKSLGKYATGEERVPTVREIADSAYKQYVEAPVKKRVRDVFAKRGEYALEKFDEGIVRYSIQDYINRLSEIPFVPKDRIEYEGNEVWGFQDGEKAEYLRARKIKENLGNYAYEIKNELGLTETELDSALEDGVKIHELAEKRLSEYVGQLSEQKHGWLQAKVVDYLRSSEDPKIKRIGEVFYRVDFLRQDSEFGKWIDFYRKTGHVARYIGFS